MKIVFSFAVLTCSLLLSLHQPASAENTGVSEKQVGKIIGQFQDAIKNKDIAGFMGLFLREDVTWTAAYTDASVERYNASIKNTKEPLATRVQAGGSPRKFIESIAKNKAPQSEIFSNVRIDTDGDIAHVWFDYTFMVGTYKSAWGKESWQLVRTETGWKISAVTWSSEENPVQPDA
ncbi:nuclear transport factor 2 family protein [Rugamonas rivuli]|uniref:Nuclear transport factor 2 family protein n=1 Tax=Rugamonas rivuli TaxID=2743358 RepID=A0A843S6T4_9BURK|nr:nuclear transport factor 2 family protein [Rugamonas rivuli]MQA18198.1 hypothetical protein [Rugamonas rivuli]